MAPSLALSSAAVREDDLVWPLAAETMRIEAHLFVRESQHCPYRRAASRVVASRISAGANSSGLPRCADAVASLASKWTYYPDFG